MMELIPADIRNLWKEWEIRLIVLFSAFLQVMLITLGSRRKSIYHRSLRVLVWFAYLTADWVAILALGVISNRLADTKEKTGNLSLNNQLTAFWAPFLLFHLGGPDSITAYSLEDNDLWVRYLKTLVVKTALTGYIYFLALTGSPLAVLAAVMTAVGFIKYAERIRSLYLASKDTLRDFMIPKPESGQAYHMMVDEYNLKIGEGYLGTVKESVEDVVIDMPHHGRVSMPLQAASDFFQIFRLLFVDLSLKVSILGSSRSVFMHMRSDDAFEIISIELSLMYDLLYTKAIMLYNSNWGIARPVITLSSTCAVIVFFSIQQWKKYLTVDICITFSLLGVAVLMEFHSILQITSSDWTMIWLLKNQNSYMGCIVRSLQLSRCRRRRWSGSVAQFSLLELYIRRQTWLAHAIPWLGQAEQMLQKHSCVKHEDFRDSMKDWIYLHVKNKVCDRLVCKVSFEAGLILNSFNLHHMTWSTDGIEFDHSILIWHIATELCYFFDRREMASKQGKLREEYDMSKVVSRYLLYLLVMHPSMMLTGMTGIGLLRYKDTSLEVTKYLDKQRRAQKVSMAQSVKKWIENLLEGNGKSEDEDDELFQASRWLLASETDIQPSEMGGGKRKSVLFNALRLAFQLKNIEPTTRRWKLISKVWAEALVYSAYCCDGYEHAKRLSKGGELLSHIWLLMAHFGICKQVSTAEGDPFTDLPIR